MPIVLTDKSYTDIYGNSSSYFKANAGDTIDVKYTFSTEIFILSSDANTIKINKITNTILQSQGSFVDEGFRVGQTYILVAVNNLNQVAGSFSGTIISVSDLQLVVTGLPSLNNFDSIDAIWCIFVEQIRSSIELGVNFVDVTLASPSLDSLLDGETNRFIANGLNTLAVNSSKTLTQIGKKSGGFTFLNPSIKRVADIVNFYGFNHNKQVFELTFQVVFHGMFDENWFTGKNCLKIYSKIDFKVNEGETFGVTTFELKEASDTGFFNTGFNTEVPNITNTIVGTDEVYYNGINTITFQITSNLLSLSTIQFGAMYILLDDDYNKNQPLSQENYLPFVKTPLWGVGDVGDDVVGSAYPFNLKLNSLSVTTSGANKIYTGDIEINPFYSNPNAFGKFIESKGDSDRIFYIWAKIGNTNTLLFSGQLQYQIPVGILLQPTLSVLVNHNKNNDYSNMSTPVDDSDFNLEDDLGFVADILINEIDSNDSINVKVIAKSGAEEFDLETITFNLFDKDLQYFVPTYLDVSNNLPSSSKKKTAYLIEKTPLTSGVIELRLYYPFLLRWENWINQQNVPPFFVKTGGDTKNWFNYQSANPAWSVKIKVEIIRNGVVDYFYKNFSFKNYDDSTIISQIKLFDYATNAPATSLRKDTIMLIKAVHTFPFSYQMTPYGQITIEPRESSPRHVLSTEIDRSSSNPLKGISYEPRLDVEYTSSSVVTFSCVLDTSKLTEAGYCITSKISEGGTGENVFEELKITEDNIEKTTEDNINKITE